MPPEEFQTGWPGTAPTTLRQLEHYAEQIRAAFECVAGLGTDRCLTVDAGVAVAVGGDELLHVSLRLAGELASRTRFIGLVWQSNGRAWVSLVNSASDPNAVDVEVLRRDTLLAANTWHPEYVAGELLRLAEMWRTRSSETVSADGGGVIWDQP